MSPSMSPTFKELVRGEHDAERERFEDEGYDENAEGAPEPDAGGPEGAGIDTADAAEEAAAERERREEQADAAAEGGRAGGEEREDPAALDPQLERAEGEGMVTEHAKVSAQDPGPDPLPEPEPEPEPDHGPGEPQWQEPEPEE